jgi:hypothetical protein
LGDFFKKIGHFFPNISGHTGAAVNRTRSVLTTKTRFRCSTSVFTKCFSKNGFSTTPSNDLLRGALVNGLRTIGPRPIKKAFGIQIHVFGSDTFLSAKAQMSTNTKEIRTRAAFSPPPSLLVRLPILNFYALTNNSFSHS